MTDLIEQIREQNGLFNVRRENVLTAGGQMIPGKKVIVNEETDQPLGIVSSNYRVVTNSEVVENMMEAFTVGNFDLTGAEAKVTQSHKGARSMIDIILPAYEVDHNGDVSKLRISTLNSYDGRWKYQSRGSAIRMACLNGQILGSFIGSYTEYHNAKLDPKLAAERMARMITEFDQAKEWWKQMMATKVDRETVLRVLAIFFTGQTKVTDRDAFLARRTVADVMTRFEGYSAEMGYNAYALYNALTDFVSHKSYKDETKAASIKQHEDRLAETLGKVKVFQLNA